MFFQSFFNFFQFFFVPQNVLYNKEEIRRKTRRETYILSVNNISREKHTVNLPLFLVVRAVFKHVSGLAVKRSADLIEGIKANALCLSVFQNGYIRNGYANFIGKLGNAHLPFREHYVYVYYYHAATPLYEAVVFLLQQGGLAYKM